MSHVEFFWVCKKNKQLNTFGLEFAEIGQTKTKKTTSSDFHNDYKINSDM